MDYAKLAYKIGSWAFVITGVGHTATTFMLPKPPDAVAFAQTMKDVTVNLAGTEVSIYSFHIGFSLMMGLLLVAFGLLNLFIANSDIGSALPKSLLVLNILTALISTLLSIKYFFIVPITLLGIAFLCFTFSLFKQTAK